MGVQQQAFSSPVNGCFKNLQFVTVSYTPRGGQAAIAPLLGLVMDDIKYTTYRC